MAQMAAQDYFSRLQMSGMMHPDLANAANLAALGNLGGFANPTTSSSPSSNKSNSKRKDKSDSYDKLDVKKMSSKEVIMIIVLITFIFNKRCISFRQCRSQTIQATHNIPIPQIYRKTLWQWQQLQRHRLTMFKIWTPITIQRAKVHLIMCQIKIQTRMHIHQKVIPILERKSLKSIIQVHTRTKFIP
jgi:hypothetical protein